MRRERCFLWAALLLPFMVIPGFGEKESKTVDDVSLTELLDIKISTAAKYEQTTAEAPASVTIITSEDIERFGYRTLDEVLLRIRGFYITNDRNFSYVGVRGYSRPTDYNNRVLLLINGHSTTENIWGSTTIGTELGLDLDAVERIEIVRGPGAALYGTNAMLAVINIITKEGKTVDGFKATFQAGSFGKLQAGVRYGKELKGGLDFLVSGHYGDIKGPDLYFAEYDDPSSNNGMAEGLDWDRYYGAFAVLKYRDLSFQGFFSSREKGIPTASYAVVFNDDRAMTRDTRQFLDLKYKRDIAYDKCIMLRAYFNRYVYHGDFPFDDEEGEYLWEEESIGEWFGVASQFNWDIRPNNRLILGAEYKKHVRACFCSWDEYDTYFDQDFPFHELALYIQDEFQVSKNVSLTLGIRYDKYSDRDESLSPRAALVFNLSRNTTLKMLYGNAYRAPNIYELYYDSDDEAKGNPFLSHERINTFEGVIEQRIGKTVFAVLSLYSFEMRDLIEQRVDPADGLLQFRNFDKVKARGVEFGLNVRLRSGFFGYINYNYQKAECGFTGLRISNSPANGLKLGLSIPLFSHFFASFEAFYESGRNTLRGTHTGAYALANVHLSSKTLFNHLKLSLQVRNLFDTEYWTPGGHEHIQNALRQNGRTFSFKLEYIL